MITPGTPKIIEILTSFPGKVGRGDNAARAAITFLYYQQVKGKKEGENGFGEKGELAW